MLQNCTLYVCLLPTVLYMYVCCKLYQVKIYSPSHLIRNDGIKLLFLAKKEKKELGHACTQDCTDISIILLLTFTFYYCQNCKLKCGNHQLTVLLSDRVSSVNTVVIRWQYFCLAVSSVKAAVISWKYLCSAVLAWYFFKICFIHYITQSRSGSRWARNGDNFFFFSHKNFTFLLINNI